ncbi:DUF5777 family beta-barrel protein [Flexithrix dorotheae]|uniref:DUF5777 family beta-barrel protein n=1 Tax=Flexithrix dorotheae TaxID=70993 RepID=UPI00036BB5C5|nr:DUF5777 family beta-barrel protein [Flexithrix dorotheae]
MERYYKKLFLLYIFLMMMILKGFAQEDDLMKILETEGDEKNQVNFATATFKGTRLIQGHSVETLRGNAFQLLISHRFGRINGGAYEFFGLDQSNVRIGLEYGLSDRLNVGIGRNSYEKTYDGFLKYKILRQSSGAANRPVSMVLFSSVALNTLKNEDIDPEREIPFSSRLAYTGQLLIARKFSPGFSLQIMPTIVHRNEVTESEGYNDLYALGFGGRKKITKSLALNVEYYYRINAPENPELHNSFSIGFDIETGGHVFQLHFTNSISMVEKGFIGETTGDWANGDIHFGFNISRTFN